MRNLLPQSAYARNVLTLMTGTSLAQAIPIAISPILTRLYSPEDFGVFALYVSISAIAAVMVTGRYELAIVLPKRDRDAMHVVALSIFLSFLFSILLLLFVCLFNASITNWLKLPEIGPWLYWVPASTLLMGVYQSLNYWNNRKAKYKRLAISRTIQGGSSALLQVGSGPAGLGGGGLVLGDISGRFLASIALAKTVYMEDRQIIINLSKIKAIYLARKYINFPKYLVFAHGVNTVSFQLPIILLGAIFGSHVPGMYMLTQRVMGAPSALIAGALGDVFRQEASYSYIHKGNCKKIFIKTLKKLLTISFFPFFLFFFLAPDLFSLLFGNQWRVAGEYARILTPMFLMQFVCTPLMSMFIIGEKQKIDFIWQMFLFVFVFLSLYFGGFFWGVYGALACYSLVYSLLYAIAGFISYRIACGIK